MLPFTQSPGFFSHKRGKPERALMDFEEQWLSVLHAVEEPRLAAAAGPDLQCILSMGSPWLPQKKETTHRTEL